jgi:CDP-glucose 4,6-dehydratase
LWGDSARWGIDTTQEQPHEASYLKLDCSKAKSLLGWYPKLPLSRALEWVAEWYQSYQQDKNMRSVTEAEILRFERLLNEAQA